MSSPQPPSNVIGPIDYTTWYTLRELRDGIRDFKLANDKGQFARNIELHEMAYSSTMSSVFKR